MKTAAILLRLPRAFPLSVWATFTREIQFFTHKYTQLSIGFGLAGSAAPTIGGRKPILPNDGLLLSITTYEAWPSSIMTALN